MRICLYNLTSGYKTGGLETLLGDWQKHWQGSDIRLSLSQVKGTGYHHLMHPITHNSHDMIFSGVIQAFDEVSDALPAEPEASRYP